VIEEKQLRHMLKVASVTGESPIRDQALLFVLCGTGMMLTEIASLTVADYLKPDGSLRDVSEVRPEIAHNNRRRPVYWSNTKVVCAINAYLVECVRQKHGITTRSVAYRSLDPDTALFRGADGAPYKLTERRTPAGAISYSCDSLSQVFRRLHLQAGIDGGHALAGRRTFAVRLFRKGYDLRHIAELLGHQTLTATKRLVDQDPVALGDLVAGVI